jgi:hypothetical protein
VPFGVWSLSGEGSRDERHRLKLHFENNHGEAIIDLEGWRDSAPPAAAYHWAEYRSAAELAHAWMDADAFERVRHQLAKEPALGDFAATRAIIERKTRFDDIPGGARNHDLLVLGGSPQGPVVIGVEGKADEPFGLSLSDYVTSARRRQPRTRAPERLERLTRAFFGKTLEDDPSLGTLGYQLFSALAGTLVEARHAAAACAVLLVHEFNTPLTRSDKRSANGRDLDAFVARLGGAPRRGVSGDWLVGPLSVPGNDWIPAEIPFYVAKLVTRVEKRTREVPGIRRVRTGRPEEPARRLRRVPGTPKSIPTTLMDVLYAEIHALVETRGVITSLQAAQLDLARAWLEEPDRLAFAFAESVRQFTAYDNRDEAFYPERANPHLETREVAALASTNDVAALVARASLVGTAERPNGAFRYVDREIVPARTTGGATFSDGRTAKQFRRLDLLLADADDRAPIIAEIKVGGDQHPLYALVQLLMLAAQLSTPNQFARLHHAYPDTFGDVGRVDLYMLLAGQQTNGIYRPELNDIAQRLSAELMQREAVTRHVRRITCFDVTLSNGRLDLATRFSS